MGIDRDAVSVTRSCPPNHEAEFVGFLTEFPGDEWREGDDGKLLQNGKIAKCFVPVQTVVPRPAARSIPSLGHVSASSPTDEQNTHRSLLLLDKFELPNMGNSLDDGIKDVEVVGEEVEREGSESQNG